MWGKLQSAAIKGRPSAPPGAEATGHGATGEGRLRATAHALREIFWRRRLIILACVALALAVTTGYVAGSPRFYEAAVLVATGDRPGETEPPAQGLKDQLRLIESRAMAERLVDRLDLQFTPEFNPLLPPDHTTISYGGGLVPASVREQLPAAWAEALGGAPSDADLTDEQQAMRLRDRVVEAVKTRIRVEPAQPSGVRVTFLSADPDLAAAAANALAELYLDDQATVERQAEGLEQEIERLTASIDATEKAIAELRATAEAATDQPDEQDLLDRTAEREFWRGERAKIEARLSGLEKLGADPSLDQAAALLDSERLGQLQARAIELERELAELSPVRDAQDPQIVSLRAELAALKDDRRVEVEQTAAQLEKEAAIIRSRETALEAQIEALDKQLTERHAVDDGTEALERQAEAERGLLQTYIDRLEQGQLPGRAAGPDGRIVAPAVVPQTPTYPRLALIYGVGLCGGLLLGILMAGGLEAVSRHAQA